MNVRNQRAGRARVAGEIGLGVLFGATLLTTATALATSWGGRYWLFGCATGAVTCGVALARRRHRLGAAVAGLAVAAVAILVARSTGLPAEPGPATALALAVLVGSAVRTLPARPAGTIAVGGLLIVAGSQFAFPPSGTVVGAVAGLNALGWLVALTGGLGLRLLDARRRDAAERVRRDERLELARELHDVVAHHITGIVVQAQAAQIVARRHPERAGAALAGIESAGSDALAAMRRVVGLLRDADDAAPTSSANPEQLGDLVRRFEGHGPAVRLRLPDGEDTSAWPPEVTSTVHRVVRESLTNVARHAPHARSVTVTVARERSAVTVEVVDDAAPAATRYPHRAGYGLIGMRERLEALGGTLRAGPGPEAGWAVRASLPVPAGGRR